MLDTTVILIAIGAGAVSLVISMIIALIIIFTRTASSPNTGDAINLEEYQERLKHDHAAIRMFHGFRGYSRPFSGRTSIGI
jgi:hypothetical protein